MRLRLGIDFNTVLGRLSMALVFAVIIRLGLWCVAKKN